MSKWEHVKANIHIPSLPCSWRCPCDMALLNFWHFLTPMALLLSFSLQQNLKELYMCGVSLVPLDTISLNLLHTWTFELPSSYLVLAIASSWCHFPSAWRTTFSISCSAGCKGFAVFLFLSPPAPMAGNYLRKYVSHKKAFRLSLSLVLKVTSKFLDFTD